MHSMSQARLRRGLSAADSRRSRASRCDSGRGFASGCYTYEKAAIEAWFLEDKSTSPKTGLALDSKHLVPNFAIRSAIDELREPRSPPPPPPPADDLVDDGELWPFDALPDYAGMWP